MMMLLYFYEIYAFIKLFLWSYGGRDCVCRHASNGGDSRGMTALSSIPAYRGFDYVVRHLTRYRGHDCVVRLVRNGFVKIDEK